MKKDGKTPDIKVCVIGYGGAFNMGKIHLEQMRDAGMTPAAVVELDKERLKAAETDFPGIETYSSAAEMLKKSDVNLVTIITPHNTHAELALKCLKEGKHVVCEKPFAVTTAECDAMIAEAKKRKLLVSAYHNRHWDGNIMFAAEKVRSGAIGGVVRFEASSGAWSQPKDWWRSSKSISGGILYDWGVHLLEYGLQILGDSEMTEVSGFSKSGFWRTKWGADTNEDEAFLTVRFKSGQLMTLRASSIESNPPPRMFEITGTKGALVMGYSDWKLITHSKNDSVITETGKCPPAQWPEYYRNIAGFLRGKEKLVITPELARRPIHIIELAGLSARKGRAMKTKHP